MQHQNILVLRGTLLFHCAGGDDAVIVLRPERQVPDTKRLSYEGGEPELSQRSRDQDHVQFEDEQVRRVLLHDLERVRALIH